jgi:hypothetical protein
LPGPPIAKVYSNRAGSRFRLRHRCKALDRHEHKTKPGGPAGRLEAAADVRRVEAQRRGHRRDIRRFAAFSGELGQGERRLAAASVVQGDFAANRPDVLCQHKLLLLFAAPRESDSGTDRRVAGKRQFRRRRENAQPGAMDFVQGRQHEHRLGVVELARNRLHRRSVEAVRVEHHRKRIAGKPPQRKHVESNVAPAHASPSAKAFGFEHAARLHQFFLRGDQQDFARPGLHGLVQDAENRRG